MGKKELAALFSSNPDRYYKVSLFDKMGFTRKKCNRCEKFFWTLDNARDFCPDHENYGFIGKPPTNKRLDYVNAWKETEKFFRANDHKIVRRYPVVCRWREDLYFTIASIVDFQRVIGNQVVFELPANPLVVPQMCLRFNDIENVGLSGRHYTGFCMIGQTCNADAPGGYWKDKCIDLDFGMLTKGLGIKAEDITFVEDVWMGAGAFGYSLEYFVRGLELGNAVFTEFEGNENDYRVMPNKIIDMGAGLERFSWITMGTPTSYDCCFGPVVGKLVDMTGTDTDQEVLTKYFESVSLKLDNKTGGSSSSIRDLKLLIAKEMNISEEQLSAIVAPYEAIYTISDHIRTLVFAISDGALPSNVGGGYNLRVILRRALSILERLGWKNTIRVEDIAELHIDYLRQMYPELEDHRQDVKTILQLEASRYSSSRERMNSVAMSLKSSKKAKELTVDDLIRLYESDGITPDFLMEQGIVQNVPSTFYTKLAELHTSQVSSQSSKPIPGLEDLPPTKLLYYQDESIHHFHAKVLKVVEGKYIVLDQTAFYPRGGGQEPDTGEIEGVKVVEVTKQADVVVHKIEGGGGRIPAEEQTVHGTVNGRRRDLITKHHTATHVLNSASRNALGSWVWQNSAFKEETYGRLDITHHSTLTREEVKKIERMANWVIRENHPVIIKTYDRGDAEQQFSFRIYQGGIVPTSNVRIVNINGWDIEACGGTHVKSTGEIGLVKIVKSERIQDGVVRLEFVAGEAAVSYMQQLDSQLASIAQALGSSREKVIESFDKAMQDAEATKKKLRAMLRVVSVPIAKSISEQAKKLDSGIHLYTTYDEELDDDYHIAIGEKAIELDKHLVYLALVSKGQGIRVIVFAGEAACKKVKASAIAKQVSGKLGGSGGGDNRFGQGGGKSKDRIREALLLAEEVAR
ncbi:MAG: alaS [Nitrososphaera sp.]|nr:alaS [Nitrososphaera sp.]